MSIQGQEPNEKKQIDNGSIPKWLHSPIKEIISSVIGAIFTVLVKQIFEQTNPLLLLVFILLFSVIVWLAIVSFTTKSLPTERIKGVITLVISGVVIVFVITLATEYMPSLQVIKQWDFEDGTTQGWGAFANDRVKANSDVVTSTYIAQGNYSLKISNINEPTNEGNARKRLVAIHFNANQLSEVRYIKVDVYLPSNVANLVGYADAKLFLKDSNFVWRDSGNGEGVRIDHYSGQWVTIEWDLRMARLFWRHPLKDFIGFQVYVKDYFDGPVYIDQITIYK